MKLKQGTDLSKYGFKQWSSGIWYLPCNVLEEKIQSDMSIIVEDNDLRLYHSIENVSTDNKWLDSIFEIPSVLIKMIKDGVVEEKDER